MRRLSSERHSPGGRWEGRVSAESMQGQALVGSCGQTEEDRSRVTRACGRTEERDARRRQPQPSRSRAAAEPRASWLIDAGSCRTPGRVNTPRERTMPRRRHTRTGATSIKQWLSTFACAFILLIEGVHGRQRLPIQGSSRRGPVRPSRPDRVESGTAQGY